ncbi:hypothetical protein I7I53_05895 [Histoplasma capsulatum var. duboisii H88]|uniref:Uncharacterized protein n=1 Tax=Ajellomyces capsulatus (strain H88) TaxID=544711 RepID=A0A8A1LFK3_AJEC8|nr:hypothetical protein I7I53_05895 [Histoplasma capsulatum var. duboisii H88]
MGVRLKTRQMRVKCKNFYIQHMMIASQSLILNMVHLELVHMISHFLMSATTVGGQLHLIFQKDSEF